MHFNISRRTDGLSISSAFLVACLCSLSTIASAAPYIEGLGTLPGSTESRAYGATADGCIVVGSSGEAFIYEKNFMRNLPDSGPVLEKAVGVTGAMYGHQAIGNNGSGQWGVEPTNAWRSSVSYPGYFFEIGDTTIANGISSNGSRVVGSARGPGGVQGHGFPWEAYRWGDSSGVSFLDRHPDTPLADYWQSIWPSSSAEAVSADGTIAVGWARYEGPDGPTVDLREAVRWDGTALAQLGFLPGATSSEATAISSDGSVIVGFSDGVGFRHEAGALVDIGSIIPSDVNGDGSIIVGHTAAGTAQIWDATDGQRDLAAWLTSEHGVDLTGWTLDRVETVSDDGRTFVGTGTNPQGGVEAWRVALDGCTSEIQYTYPGSGDMTWSVAAQPDDSSFAFGFTNRASVWLVPRTGGPIEVIDSRFDVIPYLFPGPDGSFNAVLSPAGQVLRIAADGTVSTVFESDPVSFIGDFDSAPDGSMTVMVQGEIVRIAPDGTESVVIDAAIAADQLGIDVSMFDGFARVEIASDNTIYVYTRHQTLPYFAPLQAIFEIDPSGSVQVHRPLTEADQIHGMALSPGGELWLLGDSGLLRLDDNPIDFSTNYGTIYLPGSDFEFYDLSSAFRMNFLPNGELAMQLGWSFRDNFLVSLDPATYEFSWPNSPNVIAFRQVQPFPTPTITTHAISDRAVYIATGGETIVRIPQQVVTPVCSDGVDNDGDGLTDWPEDPGCTNAKDEAEHQSTYACDDNIDNDGDGLTDFSGGDPGCASPRSQNEAPECNDGINNDPGQDSKIDMADWRCKSPADPSEACGIGFELALIMPALLALRRRQRGDHRSA